MNTAGLLVGNTNASPVGTVQMDGGTLTGTNNVLHGTLNFARGVWNGVTLTIAINGVLNLAGGGADLDFPSSVVTNYGTVNWISGTVRGGNGGGAPPTFFYNYGLWDAQGD